MGTNRGTPHGERSLFEPAGGRWLRFSAYDLHRTGDGRAYLRPAPGADFEWYDPWEPFRESRRARGKVLAPYHDLLRIAEEIEPLSAGTGKRFLDPNGRQFVLEPGSYDGLLKWCSEHGLLGLLLHRVESLTLSYQWRRAPNEHPLAATWSRDGLWPVRAAYFRINGSWVPREIILDATLFPEPGENGQLIGDDAIPAPLPKPGVSIRGPIGLSQRRWDQTFEEQQVHQYEPFKQTWDGYFPGLTVPDGVSNPDAYPYPLPTSRAFWQSYAEPVDEFLLTAQAFHEALADIENLHRKTKHSDEEQGRLFDGIHSFNDFLFGAFPTVQLSETGELQQQWTSPSLMGHYAFMALQDLTASRRRQFWCPTCAGLVLGGHPKAEYCSDRCRNTAKMRRKRAKSDSVQSD